MISISMAQQQEQIRDFTIVMSMQFAFSRAPCNRDPLFFRKSQTAPPARLPLKVIAEALDEHETHSKPTNHPENAQNGRRGEPKQQNKCSEYLKCLIRCCQYFFRPQQKWNYDLNNKDFECLIKQIKKKSLKIRPLLPPQKISKKVLVLDLDETLVHTTFNRPRRFDFEVEFSMQGRRVRAYTTKRFGLDGFLYEMAKLYEVVVFTACNQEYSCKVIQQIDPEGLIAHRLFRESGITVNGNIFLKNLAALGRELQSVVVVDDNRFAGMLQPDNFYQIETFKGHEKDKSLLHLASFLRFVHKRDAVTPVKALRASFESLNIDIIPNFIEESQIQQTHSSRLSKEMRRQLQKKVSIETQALGNELESEGETTVTNLIKSL